MIRLTRSPGAVLLGEQAPPRFHVVPDRSVSNDWEDVADLSAGYGLTLDPWQEDILKASMGVRSDGTWAAKQVGVSAPRQNGKSQLIVARALAGALVLGERKIIISAHQQDTARETFSKFLELFDAHDGLRAKVKQIMNAFNREFIKFNNGAEIRFKARSTSGGRGFSSDLLLLDEAQILKMSAWVSINSTMSARPNPQIWLLGTPPTPEDNGEVFTSIRESALAGRSSALAYLEWSAEPTDDPAAEETRAKANPAWLTRINHDVVQGEYETYPRDRFALDRLGIWADELGVVRAFDADLWRSLGVDVSPNGVRSYAVAFSPIGDRMALAGHIGTDESGHVELIDAIAENIDLGLTNLADWFAAPSPSGLTRWRTMKAVVLSGAAGTGVLKQYLMDRGVPASRIVIATTQQYLQACEMFREAVEMERSVTHLVSEGQAPLDGSVAVTDKDRRGGWMATTEDGDETPLEAVSLALWIARTSKRTPAGEQGRALVL